MQASTFRSSIGCSLLFLSGRSMVLEDLPLIAGSVLEDLPLIAGPRSGHG